MAKTEKKISLRVDVIDISIFISKIRNYNSPRAFKAMAVQAAIVHMNRVST